MRHFSSVVPLLSAFEEMQSYGTGLRLLLSIFSSWSTTKVLICDHDKHANDALGGRKDIVEIKLHIICADKRSPALMAASYSDNSL